MKAWFLRWQLKRRYLRYVAIRDAYDCGTTLAYAVSNRLWQARDAVNQTIRKLKATGVDIGEI